MYDYIRATSTGPTKPSTNVSASTAAPSEKSVSVNDTYSVPDGQPRVVKIDAIGVNAYVERVGVNASNAMATPVNVNFIGWYVKSVAPGSNGLSIMDGHLTGRYTDGVFKRLSQLKKGDAVDIQLGDLSWVQYSVSSLIAYSVDDAAKPLYMQSTSAKKELHLITCDGVFDASSHSYDKRLIVTATST